MSMSDSRSRFLKFRLQKKRKSPYRRLILLVVGTGPTLWEDLERWDRMQPPRHHIAVVNQAGAILKRPIQHWATYHPEDLAKRMRQRKSLVGHGAKNERFLVHSHVDHPLVDRVWNHELPPGSSAHLAVRVGLGLGYRLVVLAGVPLTGHHFEHFSRGWHHSAPDFRGKVSSFSGYTAELLGEPTQEWLRGGQCGALTRTSNSEDMESRR